MNKIKLFSWTTLCVFISLLSGACKAEKHEIPTVDLGGPKEETPGENLGVGKEVLVWVDARSNVFGTYGKFSDKTAISGILDQLKDAGVTGLVVDVKPSSGYTMYPSAYAKEFTTLDGKTRPVDYVDFIISEGKKRNLKVYVSIVTFVEGDGVRRIGHAFDQPEFKEKYESIVVKDATGARVRISETGKNIFVNPAHEEVQTRALNMIKEITQKFEIDGLILDYARYTDINADFSDYSKAQFISFLKTKYNDTQAANMDFPKDVVSSWKETSGQLVPNQTGKYYKQWLVYRASVIQGFFQKARQAVKTIKPNIKFGVYVGAWYSSYYQVGVNWASKDYDPFQDFNLRFDWAFPGYGETGYLEELDLLMTGNYFTQIKLSENTATANLKYHWWSIEGSLNGIEYITKNKRPVYGSLDVGNIAYASTSEISRAIQYIRSRASGGVMIFDLVHIYAPEYNTLKTNLFPALKAGIQDK